MAEEKKSNTVEPLNVKELISNDRNEEFLKFCVEQYAAENYRFLNESYEFLDTIPKTQQTILYFWEMDISEDRTYKNDLKKIKKICKKYILFKNDQNDFLSKKSTVNLYEHERKALTSLYADKKPSMPEFRNELKKAVSCIEILLQTIALNYKLTIQQQGSTGPVNGY